MRKIRCAADDPTRRRLVHALQPERCANVEATVRGEHRPQVSLLITSLETAWAS